MGEAFGIHLECHGGIVSLHVYLHAVRAVAC
jgi:hypothetical protein